MPIKFKNGITFLLCWQLILNPTLTLAQTEDTVQQLKEACNDEKQYRNSPPTNDHNGNLVYYRYLVADNSKKTFDCRGVGVMPLPVSKSVTSEATPTCENCSSPSNLQVQASEGLVMSACPVQKKSNTQCLDEVICAQTQAIANFAAFKFHLDKSQKSCGSLAGGESCVQDIAAGIGVALVDLVKSIGYLAEAGWGLAKDTLKNFFSKTSVHKTDHAISKILIALQKMSASEFKKMITNTAGWIKEILKLIIAGIFDTAKKAAVCNKWTGAPLVSTCAEPLPAWDCMSCGEKMSATCALVGVVSSDLVLMFVAGLGVAKITDKLADSAEAISKIQKISKAAMDTKLGKASVVAGKIVVEPTKFIGKTALKALETLDKIPGLKQWAYLNEKAFLKGMALGGNNTSRTLRLVENASLVNKKKELPEVEVPVETEVVRLGAPAEDLHLFTHDESRLLNYCRGAP